MDRSTLLLGYWQKLVRIGRETGRGWGVEVSPVLDLCSMAEPYLFDRTITGAKCLKARTKYLAALQERYFAPLAT
jgi:hypothetical protein